jgi:hypothetical protein
VQPSGVVSARFSSHKSTAGLNAGPDEFVFIVAARLADLIDHEGIPAMAQANLDSTDPMLLKRVAALSDNPAWVAFFRRYDPFVRGWSSAWDLDDASVLELCHGI